MTTTITINVQDDSTAGDAVHALNTVARAELDRSGRCRDLGRRVLGLIDNARIVAMNVSGPPVTPGRRAYDRQHQIILTLQATGGERGSETCGDCAQAAHLVSVERSRRHSPAVLVERGAFSLTPVSGASRADACPGFEIPGD